MSEHHTDGPGSGAGRRPARAGGASRAAAKGAASASPDRAAPAEDAAAYPARDAGARPDDPPVASGAPAGERDDGEAEGAAASPTLAGPRRVRGQSLAIGLAVALALLATAIAGALWWQYRQFYVALHEADVALEASLERVRATQRTLSDGLGEVGESVEASRRRADSFAERLADLPGRLAEIERQLGDFPGRLAAMERRVDAVQGGSFNARENWLRAEAEYYLTLANSELDLAGRWDNALAALELADDRLRQLSDPTLSVVRRQVAAERLALESTERPDLERVVFDLANLAAKVEELPLRGAGTNIVPDEGEPESLDDAEPGFGRLVLGLKRALRSLVSIERRDDADPRPLSAERRALARRELGIELQLARIAATRGQAAAYAASLTAAAAVLERDFDAADAAIQGAARLVAELSTVNIAPPRPDIGRSLTLLRGLPAGTD